MIRWSSEWIRSAFWPPIYLVHLSSPFRQRKIKINVTRITRFSVRISRSRNESHFRFRDSRLSHTDLYLYSLLFYTWFKFISLSLPIKAFIDSSDSSIHTRSKHSFIHAHSLLLTSAGARCPNLHMRPLPKCDDFDTRFMFRRLNISLGIKKFNPFYSSALRWPYYECLFINK